MRFAILGNSGSGKSTLAAWLARSADLAVLDLDTVAWEPDRPAVARSSAQAEADVSGFCAARPRWVLEGCYANLVEAALRFQPFLVFLNPGLEQCAAHYTREGPMSLAAHQALFEKYPGRKAELRRAPRLDPPEPEVSAWLR